MFECIYSAVTLLKRVAHIIGLTCHDVLMSQEYRFQELVLHVRTSHFFTLEQFRYFEREKRGAAKDRKDRTRDSTRYERASLHETEDY